MPASALTSSPWMSGEFSLGPPKLRLCPYGPYDPYEPGPKGGGLCNGPGNGSNGPPGPTRTPFSGECTGLGPKGPGSGKRSVGGRNLGDNCGEGRLKVERVRNGVLVKR